MEFLDTNVVVRYFTDDPPPMSERATALIESATELTVSPLVIAEVGYILTRVYGRNRMAVVELLIELLKRPNLLVYQVDKAIAIAALELCRPSNRISFPDALLWAEARSAGASAVHTFDRRFPRDGIKVKQV